MNMGLPDDPCHGCTERKVGCHSHCQEYLRYKILCRVIRRKQFINLMQDHPVMTEGRRRGDRLRLLWAKHDRQRR